MVFFGEVVDVDWESIGRSAATGPTVRFTVIEVFKGDPPRDLSVDLTTWSEEKRFAFGQRAIVYLKKSGANWTSACRRLHYAAGVDDLEVSWLRKMRDGSPGGQVFGTIASSTDPTRSNLRQIRVRLVQQGRPIAETRTDVAGRFDFGWRLPGAYVLAIAPSERFTGALQPIVVPPIGTCTPIAPISLSRQ